METSWETGRTMRGKNVHWVVLLVCGIALAGCGYTNTSGTSGGAPAPGTGTGSGTGTSPGTGTTAQASATFTQVNQQIIQPDCISCHGSGGTSPDLSSYGSFATNTQYIVPGNPQQSLIYTITASGQMPRGRAPLTQDQQTLLYNWIAAGAQND